jgi:hypothetical protein
MAYVDYKTKNGLRRNEATGEWYVIELTTAVEDSGSEAQVVKQRILHGPFKGVGAKLSAIKAGGTNQVLA